MLQAWVGTPLVLTFVCLGLGLLVRRLTIALPGAATVPVGLAALIVLTGMTTATSRLAPASTVVVLALSIVGYAAHGIRWPRRRLPAIGLAAVGTYLVYAAPALLAGRPTFAGWIKLDDGATWLAMTDRLLSGGRNTAGLPPSTYETTLAANFATSYPTGAFPPLGVAAAALRTDAAFVLQPYLAWLAANLTLSLGGLLAAHRTSAGWQAWVAFIASQPALLLGYSLWGGVKEAVLAALLALIALLVVLTCARPGGAADRRAVLCLGLAFGSVLLVAGISGGMWLIIPTAWVALARLRRHSLGTAAADVGLLAAVTLVVALPNLVHVRLAEFAALAGYAAPDPSVGADIGNLTGRLSLLQVVGVWPAGDFRDRPLMGPTWLLIALVLASASYGLAAAGRTGSWEVPMYVAMTLPVALVAGMGGAWVGAKALAIASPALLCAAGLGMAVLAHKEATGAVLAMTTLTIGVLWGSALAYREVWLAPAEELAELRAIGADPQLTAPALMLDFNPYGARHFLRGLAAQGAGELRRDVIPTVSGDGLAKGAYADVDQFPLTSLAPWGTLVLRRSVLASRPPSDWELARSGRTYEVWTRQDPTHVRRVLAHLPLGGGAQPAARPDCDTIRALAATAPAGAELAYVPRGEVIAAVPSQPLPPGWQGYPSGQLLAPAAGPLRMDLDVPEDGVYHGFLGGSFRGSVRISVDGRPILSDRHRLTWPGHGTMTEPVALGRGSHPITLEYGGPDWRPGSAGPAFAFGPLLFAAGTDKTAVRTIPVERGDSLCDRRLDWVELVSPS